VFDASGQPPKGDSGSSGEPRRPLLGELLIQAQVVTAEQLAEALVAQEHPATEKKIGQLLIERGWMTEAQLTQTLSLQLSVPWVSLYHIDFSRQLLNRVHRDLAEKHCLIPIFVRHVKGQGETLYVAMDDPTDTHALGEVSRQANLPARPMIASATDIRSAIRVYYGESPGSQFIDVPPPPTRVEARPDPPMTTREGVRREPASPAPPVVTPPEPPRGRPSQPPRTSSQPSQPAPAPPTALAARRSAPSHQNQGEAEIPPPTTRSNPSSVGGRAAVLAASAAEGGAPPTPRAAEPAIPIPPRPEGAEPRRGRAKMLSLTLLDGTTVQLPSGAGAKPEGLTARDFISALRASSHGADASDVLGEHAQWEPVVAALLSILLRKGLIADWELMEELRKI